jgi:hypothetical protein
MLSVKERDDRVRYDRRELAAHGAEAGQIVVFACVT